MSRVQHTEVTRGSSLTTDCIIDYFCVMPQIWTEAWARLSSGGRGWFTWPDASQPRTGNDQEFEKTPPGPDDEPLSNYCLCILDVFECELSKLREKVRIEYHSKLEDGNRVWTQQDMNP